MGCLKLQQFPFEQVVFGIGYLRRVVTVIALIVVADEFDQLRDAMLCTVFCPFRHVPDSTADR